MVNPMCMPPPMENPMSATTSRDPATLLLPVGSFIAPAPIEPAPLVTAPEFVSPSHDETLDTRLDAEASAFHADDDGLSAHLELMTLAVCHVEQRQTAVELDAIDLDIGRG